MQAQALWYAAAGRAELREETVAAPGADDVLVRALHGALSRGTEALVFHGRVPPSEYRTHARAAHGRRVSVPGQVRLFDRRPRRRRRAARAALCSRSIRIRRCLRCRRTRVVPVPDNVPPQRAVLAANMETALNAVWDGAPGPADRIAVVGAGVVGALVAYLCAATAGRAGDAGRYRSVARGAREQRSASALRRPRMHRRTATSCFTPAAPARALRPRSVSLATRRK